MQFHSILVTPKTTPLISLPQKQKTQGRIFHVSVKGAISLFLLAFSLINQAGWSQCTTIPVITCNTLVTASTVGTGVWSPGSCGFSTPGQEKVYSFTAVTSGVHTLQVTSTSGTGYIDYFYKEFYQGCGPSGWTCIDDISSPGAVSIGPLNADSTYYILLDPETTSSVTQTFQITCPYVPCASIPSFQCSTPVIATTSGAGVWSQDSCGFATPGRELVYSFTPAYTGSYYLLVTSTSGGYIDYSFKNAYLGCNAYLWNCIDDIASPTFVFIDTLFGDSTYYFLLDPEVTTSVTQTFQIKCLSDTFPVCPVLPTSPANGANTGCPNSNQTLSWPVSPDATSYDVYFGTSSTPPFVTNTASTSYTTGNLGAGTYYWQIRPRNSSGPASGCPIWSFSKVDNTPPTLTCPSSISINALPGICSAVVTWGISATDNCTIQSLVQTAGPVTNTSIPVGIYTVAYRATDGAGNSSTCSFTVSVIDNQAPVITCPANITVNAAPGLCSAVVTWGISATDNCTIQSLVQTAGPVTNTSIPVGFYTVAYRVTDGAGNSSTCSFTVTVRDLQPPTITCPANVSVQCASLVLPVNIASVTAADNCGPPTVTWVSDVITNQTCVNRYTLTRTYRATDASGNSASCAQTISVNDNTAPVITFTDPLLQGVPNGGTIYVQCEGQNPDWDLPSFGTGSVSTSDNCNGAVSVTFLETLQDDGNCSVDGYINLYRQRWIATDACGNSTTAIVYVALVDEVPPVIHGVPADIQVNCDEIPAPPDDVYATDECLCACVILFSESNPAPGCRDGQVIVRTWIARDDCGNETIEKQNITLVDHKGPELRITQPEIAGLPDGTILEYTCNEGGIPAFYDHLNVGTVYSEPSCGTAGTITFDKDIILSNNCDYFGYIEQRVFRWDAIDQCGNKTSLTLTANLIDDESPVLVGVPSLTCIGDLALNEVEAIDNCGNGNVRYWDVPVASPCGTGNAVRRTYEGFDPCGNAVRDTAIILTDNNSGPSIVFTNPELAALTPGEILTINCQANGSQYTSFGTDDVRVNDDCPLGINVSYQETVVQSGDCTTANGVLAVIQLEWTATDMCGHSTQLTVMVHVVDHLPPVFLNFDAEMTISCTDSLPGIQVTDNCGEVQLETAISVQQHDCPFEYDVLRVFSATDPCGNVTALSQIIHVGDRKGPEIYGVVEEICDDLSLPKVTAFDRCADQYVEVTMTETEVQGTCREGRVIERIWSATDACGNSATKHQRIILGDQTPPTIQVPTHSVIRKFLDTGLRMVNLSQSALMHALNDLDEYSIFIEDECDEAIIPVFTLDVSYADNCMTEGYYERRVYTWVATDICGNSNVLSIAVDIMDDVVPVISQIPEGATIICAPLPPAGIVKADDYAHPVTIVYAQSMVDGASPGEYSVTRTWIATDVCGNSSQATQHITWIPDTQLSCDIFVPELIDCNSHGVAVTSGASGGLGDISYAWEVFGEKCFIQSGQGTPEIGMYIGWDQVEITLTLTDAYGCSTTCEATLDCEDLSPGPIVVNPGDHVAEIQNHQIPVIPSTAEAGTLESSLKQFNLWPNPAKDAITISFESMLDQDVLVSLMNFMGQTFMRDDIKAAKGTTTHQVDISKIPEGGYMMQLQTKGELYTKIIMVIRKE